MALFMKQDFTPPILSRKWIAIKFRPNVLLHSREHIIAILESGLLFREDSIEVEQEAPAPEDVWKIAGGGRGGWMTRGERVLSLLAVCAGVYFFPPRNLHRSGMARVSLLAVVPLSVRLCHRLWSRGTALNVLLSRMRDYLALARRAAACLKEYTAMCKELDSVTTVLESTHTLLCRQQTELALLMSRASSALLGNAPWLRADVAWEAVSKADEDHNLLKIHHAFLVVQSTLLKHIAMAHYVPSAHAQKIYKNHNERLYWLHTVLIEHLNEEFKENYESLDRMYRLLKNYGNKDLNTAKKPGFAINDSWLYSEVHSGVARTSLELKMALNKCTSLDMFLDSCALNKQELNLEVLNKDLDGLIDGITKCLNTTQSAQLRLKKLQAKFGTEKDKSINNNDREVAVEDETEVLKIEDKDPESKDEVFYFVKTEDDVSIELASDVTTAPGKKEKDTTKIVLNELKRKLVKREDLMRERERQALVKTMPELKNRVPEFPRQIKIDDVENKKGYIHKLPKRVPKTRLFKKYKIHYKRRNKVLKNKYILMSRKYNVDSDLGNYIFEAKVNLKGHKIVITISIKSHNFVITRWYKYVQTDKKPEFDSSGMSEGLSDVEAGTVNKTVNHAFNYNVPKENQKNEATNFKFTKKDLELSPSSSESDYEGFYNERKQQMSLLKDVRRHRVARKKNHPVKRGSIPIDKEEVDESLRPMEYSFGTGMAIASVLQINNKATIPNMAQEEVFIGDGEVSNDSGNDEDA